MIKARPEVLGRKSKTEPFRPEVFSFVGWLLTQPKGDVWPLTLTHRYNEVLGRYVGVVGCSVLGLTTTSPRRHQRPSLFPDGSYSIDSQSKQVLVTDQNRRLSSWRERYQKDLSTGL